MALKGCIKKAGKALDASDREYINDLLRPDEEILSRLEQRIERERDEAVELFENQGIAVQRKSTETNVAGLQGTEGSAPPSPGGSPATLGFGTESVESDPGPGKSKPHDSGALYLTRETADAALAKLSANSDLITRYLKGNRKQLFLDAAKTSYLPDVDVINVQGPRSGNRLNLNNEADLKRQVEMLEHEILHANTVAYMTKHLTERTDASVVRDIKYLSKAVVELGSLNRSKLSKETAQRINYILSHSDIETSVAEFIAIMGSETDVFRP
jgi:hypothetical protein